MGGGKMSWYQQRDCQSSVLEFSDGKLKLKGFFHSVQQPSATDMRPLSKEGVTL
jgi:hypothetical protein